MSEIDHLDILINKANELISKEILHFQDISAWDETAEHIVTRVFGDSTNTKKKVEKLTWPANYNMSWNDYELSENLKKNMLGRIKIIEEYIFILKLDKPKEIQNNLGDTKKNFSSVFIVHGHNHNLLSKCISFVERLGLNPIVLTDRANKGRTVIEKFEQESEHAGFAIVLMTGDDVGRSKESTSKVLNMRARQNVILELGYFHAKLGRENLIVLYEEGVEVPSDYNGIVYLKYDDIDNWQYKAIDELKSAGFKVSKDSI